jgi:hypothetical protein
MALIENMHGYSQFDIQNQICNITRRLKEPNLYILCLASLHFSDRDKSK